MELKITIQREDNIVSFNQLTNEDIIICYSSIYMEIIKLIDEDKYKIIQITKIREKEKQNFSLKFRVVEIKENEFIIIIRDKSIESMRLWKKFNEMKYECITIFRGPLIYNALKLNEKEFTILEYIHMNSRFKYSPRLTFYNSKNYSFITKIEFIIDFYSKPSLKYPYSELLNENMCLLNEDLFCVGIQNNGIYFIKISTHEIIKRINNVQNKFKFVGSIRTFIKYTNNLFLISSYICDINTDMDSSAIIIFNYEKENMGKVLILSNGENFYYCSKLNNDIILTYNNNIINFLNLNI